MARHVDAEISTIRPARRSSRFRWAQTIEPPTKLLQRRSAMPFAPGIRSGSTISICRRHHQAVNGELQEAPRGQSRPKSSPHDTICIQVGRRRGELPSSVRLWLTLTISAITLVAW